MATRDVRLGRIALVTLSDEFAETLGDTLEVVGSAVTGGERRARPYSTSIPVHGASDEIDSYGRGDTLRRQIRSLLDNSDARLNGTYFWFEADPQLSGWLLIGGGELKYAKGGPSLGEYDLTLQDMIRVAAPWSHRPARRVGRIDRRLSTTPRDSNGMIYSTNFAGVYGAGVAVPQVWLPPGVTDIVGANRTALPIPGIRVGRDGNVIGFADRPLGEVVSFEQAEGRRFANDVVIYDRRNSWFDGVNGREVNWLKNPRATKNLTGWAATPAPTTFTQETSTATPFGSHINLAATLGASATTLLRSDTGTSGSPVVPNRRYSGGAHIRVVTQAAGFLYRVRIDWYDAFGTFISSSNGTQVTVGGTLPAMQFLAVENVLPPTSTAFVALAVEVQAPAGGGAYDIDVSGMSLVDAVDLPDFFDGDTLGYAWRGLRGASYSGGPYGRFLQPANPSAETNIANVAVYGTPGPAISRWTGWAKDGSWSFRVRANYATAGNVTGLAWTITSVIPLSQRTARATFRVNQPLPTGSTGAWFLRFEWLDVLGAIVSTSNSTEVQLAGQAEGFEATITHSVAAPGTAYSMRMIACQRADQALGGIDYSVDAAMVVPGATIDKYRDGLDFDVNGQFQVYDPQDYGWEEVYGPNFPLTRDAPCLVLDNGLVRVREIPTASDPLENCFAVDRWAQGTSGFNGAGWVEVGRILLMDRNNDPGTTTGRSVIAWTPESAVIRFAQRTGTYRLDIFLRLDRGWLGPRVEVYSNLNLADPQIVWVPNTTGAATLILPSGVAIASGDPSASWTGYAGFTYTTSTEPWAVLATDEGVGAMVLSPLMAVSPTHVIDTLDETQTYGAARKAVRMQCTTVIPNTTTYWCGVQMAWTQKSLWFEAESFRNTGSGTTAQAADAAASAGQVVTESQAASTNPTLTVPLATVPPQLPGQLVSYQIATTDSVSGVWVRARLSGAGTMNIRARLGTSAFSSTVTSTSTTFVWLFLSVPHTSSGALEIYAHVSAAGPLVHIDRVYQGAMTSNAATNPVKGFDGVTELAYQSLWETAATPELLAR